MTGSAILVLCTIAALFAIAYSARWFPDRRQPPPGESMGG